MKAVILAGGKGTRMAPLTEDTPKPLLRVGGKPIVMHNVEAVREHVDEIIIVAGYLKNEFENVFNDDEDVRIVEQKEQLGTADAALTASEHVEEEAIILNGDDIYGENLEKLSEKDYGLLASEVEEPSKYGVYKVDDGVIEGIVEKPENPPSKLVNTGCFKIGKDFFRILEKVEKSERGEFEITDALQKYIELKDMEVVKAERWLPCSYPWQLIAANRRILEEDVSRKVEGEVAESAVVKGDVVVEEGAEIKANSVIEGPAVIKKGCEVGPSAYIRPGTVLERNVKVGKSEVKNSVISRGSSLPHFNYVGDSYVAENVNLGAGAKTANVRNDGENVKMKVKGELLDTGRKKMGAVIASGSKIGINCSINPGRKIGKDVKTDSNVRISEDVGNGSVVR